MTDPGDLAKLADDLRGSPKKLNTGARAVVAKAALNIKTDWRHTWSGLRHAPQLAGAITYDVSVKPGQIIAEIGPDKSRPQGPLGNIIEFGTSKNPPHPGGGPALEREAPRFEAAMDKIMDGLFR